MQFTDYPKLVLRRFDEEPTSIGEQYSFPGFLDPPEWCPRLAECSTHVEFDESSNGNEIRWLQEKVIPTGASLEALVLTPAFDQLASNHMGKFPGIWDPEVDGDSHRNFLWQRLLRLRKRGLLRYKKYRVQGYALSPSRSHLGRYERVLLQKIIAPVTRDIWEAMPYTTTFNEVVAIINAGKFFESEISSRDIWLAGLSSFKTSPQHKKRQQYG